MPGCPSAAEYPMLLLQATSASLPMLDCVFIGQPKHSVLSSAAYVSAWQLAHDVAAWAEYLPAAHCVHALEPTVPL